MKRKKEQHIINEDIFPAYLETEKEAKQKICGKFYISRNREYFAYFIRWEGPGIYKTSGVKCVNNSICVLVEKT